MDRSSLTRLFLRLFMASVAINAALGIWALLVGNFGDTEGRVLVTSFLVSATMLSVLVNAPATTRRALWPAPVIGAGAAVLGFVQFIVMVWADTEGDNWFKLAGSFLVVAAGATLAANLGLIQLPDRFRSALPITTVFIAALTLAVLFAIWGEPGGDWFGRLIGVLSVLVAAGTLLIPALSRFGGPDDDGQPGWTGGLPPDHGVRHCPSCGQRLTDQPLGAVVHCDRCGLVFEVLEAAPAFDPADRS